MKDYYLEFEKPIQEIDLKILELKSDESSDKKSSELSSLELARESTIKEIFSNLSRWDRVQLARHPQRPLSLDYINYVTDDFIELHGDRYFGDDKNTKDNLLRNFGMMRPEGYRKALRLMKLAEKFNLPVITLLDTPGAYPGLGAEERGQGEAIAKNLLEMSKLEVPIISIVIGEGASGGALGIGICDKMIMLENTWYSVISPEGCASILWRDAAKAPEAADAMKVMPEDLKKMGICDQIIKEPLGGAHRDFEKIAEKVKNTILQEIKVIQESKIDDFLEKRINRYDKMGIFSKS